MMKFLLVIVVLLGFSALASAQLSGYLSSSELAAKQRSAKQYLSIDPQSAYDAYFSTRILDGTQVANYDCDCEAIAGLAKSKDNVDRPIDIFYGVKASEACKCEGKINVPAKVLEAVKNKLEAEDLESYAGAALAAKALGKSAPPKGDVVKKIKMLMQPSGLFKSKKGSASSASIANTKLALTVLSEYAQGGDELNEVASAVAGLLADEDNEMVSDPTLLSYLQGLSGKKPVLDSMKGQSGATRMLAIAEGLVAYKYSTCLSRVATAIESMVIMQSYKARPAFIQLEETSFKYGESVKAKVVVKDIFGKDVSASVSAMAVKSTQKEGRDKELYSGDITKGTFDLSSVSKAELTPGRYVVDLAVTLPDRTKPTPFQAFFVIQAPLDVLSVRAGVGASKTAAEQDFAEVQTQNGWSGEEASANTKQQFVHIDFVVATPTKTGSRFQKPHQVFVKFAHKETGTQSFFVAGADGSYAGDKKYKGFGSKYSATVAIAKEAETFYHLSGEYTVSVLVADVSAEAQEWVVGSVGIEIPALDKATSSLYTFSLLDTSDKTLAALPEITHLMRPAPVNAAPVISITFALIAIVPLVVFLGFVLSLKPDLARMKNLTSTLFAFGIVATCLLYAAYWFTLPGASFYETIKYLIFGFPCLVLVGRGAVSAVIGERTKEDNKDKKE